MQESYMKFICEPRKKLHEIGVLTYHSFGTWYNVLSLVLTALKYSSRAVVRSTTWLLKQKCLLTGSFHEVFQLTCGRG